MSRDAQTGHELSECIIYGPVHSRRYGMTVGINLLPPTVKFCNFNCVYCQLGWNEVTPLLSADAFPQPKELARSLTDFFKSPAFQGAAQPDYVVISGNGEPTLHPDFVGVLDAIHSVQADVGMKFPIVCFTNGSRLHDPGIRNSLNRLNECAVKFDASSERVNLPHKGWSLDKLIDGIRSLQSPVIQSCFVSGTVSNTTTSAIEEWAEHVAMTRPKRVDIYTLSRVAPTRGLCPVSSHQLHLIADVLRSHGDMGVRIFPA